MPIYGTMTQYISVAADDRVESRNGVIKLHGPEAFEGMRRAGKLAAEILDALAPHVVPGVTTQDLDEIVYRMTLEGGGVPATLGYRGYTKSCCISINHVVCHGIPADRALKEGDIVNIDVTPIVDGWHGDTSRMYLVGDVAHQSAQTRRRHLRMPDARSRGGEGRQSPWRHCQRDPAPCRIHRYSVVRDFCGHGVGRLFHDSPEVVHAGRPGTGPDSGPA